MGVTLLVVYTFNQMAVEEKNWNIIVCGHVDKPFAIPVPDPAKWSISDLKKKVSEMTRIAENEQTFYFKEEKLEEGKFLTEYEIKNGVALSLALKPVIVSVDHAELGTAVQVEVAKAELSRWTVKHLREIVCFKFGFEISSDNILALDGKILEDGTKINDHVKNDCIITFTPVKHVRLTTPDGIDERVITLPINVSLPQVFYKKEKGAHWKDHWSLCIKLGEDEKYNIILKNHQSTPVFELRELVQKQFSIPPHQQKLKVGTTVLEDWSDEGDKKLLRNYPCVHDGVTIELDHVTVGPIHVKLSTGSPNYINIPNPTQMTVRILMNIMKNCGVDISGGKIHSKCDSRRTSVSDKPVSSVDFIKDGCELTTMRL